MADSYNEYFGQGGYPDPGTLELRTLMDDNAASTQVLDRSGNARHGTLTNAGNTSGSSAVGPAGYLPQALQLDGINDYINFAYDLVTRPCTISLRFQSNSFGTTDSQPTLLMSGAFLLAVNGSTKFPEVGRPFGWFRATSGTVTTGWHHLLISAGLSSFKLYLDGVLVLDQPAAIDTGGTTVAIGARLDAIGTPFNLDGRVADLAITSQETTMAEVNEILAGPELVNTVAPPAPAGSGLVDFPHTASPGTWDLPAPFAGLSNGPAAYSFQWYTATDASGTAAAPIVGATSSSFTPTAAQLGFHLGYLVTASNDGGTDPNAATFSAWTADPIISGIPSDGWTAQRAGVLFTSRSRRTVLWDNSRPGHAVLWG